MFGDAYSSCASAMILPPLPAPKSYHRLRSVFTLKEGSCSSLNGELYHRLPPCCLTGLYPRLCRYSSMRICFASFMFIIFLVLSRYCFWVFRPYPFMCYGLHPLYFTLLYICPQTKVKRFPVCAVMVEAGYETIPFSVLSYRCSCQV